MIDSSRRTIIVLLALSLILVITLSAFRFNKLYNERKKINSNETIAYSPLMNIKIQTNSANISIVPDIGSSVVINNGKLKRFKIKKNGSSVEISEQDAFTPKKSNLLEIRVPRDGEFGEIKINTASGSIFIDSLTLKKITSESVSGDVNLRRVKSNEINAKSISGDVNLENSEASSSSTISSTSGTISLINFFSSKISIKELSGKIDINSCLFDSLNINTVSGNITIITEDTDPDIKFRNTGFGKANLDIFGTYYNSSTYQKQGSGSKINIESNTGRLTVKAK